MPFACESLGFASCVAYYLQEPRAASSEHAHEFLTGCVWMKCACQRSPFRVSSLSRTYFHLEWIQGYRLMFSARLEFETFFATVYVFPLLWNGGLTSPRSVRTIRSGHFFPTISGSFWAARAQASVCVSVCLCVCGCVCNSNLSVRS